ncbi:MAG: hypothetical protein M0R06_00665, partial [Sphaerochaeta sp.]|nr:hypothetical protein [Sphaerochaeta sp.]
MCHSSLYAQNAGIRRTRQEPASSAAAGSRSTSQPRRLTIQTLICPKHGLARREAGDQCAECNRDRAKQMETRYSSDGLNPKACAQCEWSGFIAPSGNEGFIC